MKTLTTIVVCLFAATIADILQHLKRHRRDLEYHDLHIRDLTERSPEPYPDVLHLEVRSPDGETETLRLKRNPQFNADMHVETSGDKKRHIFNDDKAEYISERAAFHVRAEFENDHIKRSFTGLLNKRGEKYFVQRDMETVAVKLPPISNPIDVREGQRLHDELKVPKVRAFYSQGQGRRYPTSYALRPSIMFVIDYGIYKKFGGNTAAVQRITNYYTLLFAGLRQHYNQANYAGMSISPRLSKIHIITTDKDDKEVLGADTKDETSINGNPALRKSGHWFKATQKKGQNLDIDHAMTFTNHRMYRIESGRRSYSVVGLAYPGTICGYWAESMVEDDFSFSAISTSAHELGHNLGSTHDKGTCGKDYIMYAYVSNGRDTTFRNRYKFSNCSLDQIYYVAQGLNIERQNCMADEPNIPLILQALQYRIAGNLHSRDQQCEMFNNEKGSKYCGDESTCRKMSCTRPKTGRCEVRSWRHALHGTPCGTGKHCVYGECVPKA